MIFCNIYRERERSHAQKLQVCVHLDVCVTPVRHFLGYPTLAVTKATLPVLANLLLQMNLGGCFDPFYNPKIFDSDGDFWSKFSQRLNQGAPFFGGGEDEAMKPYNPPPETNKGGSPEANQNISPLKRKNFSGDDKTLFCKIRWVHFSKVLLDVMLQIFQPKKRFDESISIPSPLETSLWCD